MKELPYTKEEINQALLDVSELYQDTVCWFKNYSDTVPFNKIRWKGLEEVRKSISKIDKTCSAAFEGLEAGFEKFHEPEPAAQDNIEDAFFKASDNELYAIETLHLIMTVTYHELCEMDINSEMKAIPIEQLEECGDFFLNYVCSSYLMGATIEYFLEHPEETNVVIIEDKELDTYFLYYTDPF